MLAEKRTNAKGLYITRGWEASLRRVPRESDCRHMALHERTKCPYHVVSNDYVVF